MAYISIHRTTTSRSRTTTTTLTRHHLLQQQHHRCQQRYQTTFGTAAQAIIAASGLEPSYQYLLTARSSQALPPRGSAGCLSELAETVVAPALTLYSRHLSGRRRLNAYRAGVSGSAFTDTGSPTKHILLQGHRRRPRRETAASNEVSFAYGHHAAISPSIRFLRRCRTVR